MLRLFKKYKKTFVIKNTNKKASKPKPRKRSQSKLSYKTKELVIRVIMKKQRTTKPIYHLVVTRRRSHANARLDKIGFYEVFKDSKRIYHVLGLNREKFRSALAQGASIHISAYKLLLSHWKLP
jgi:ribosomal protein S16